MALFGNLSEKLNNIFGKLRSKGRLSEQDIKQAMREIRVALLEADVNFGVVKQFIATVSEKAVGENILKSLTPGQQVVKIVNDELVALMGSTNSKLEVSPKPPTVIMMCGLQGAGKTTMCGKLAQNLIKQGKKPMLCACDIYRPAAINQLKVVGRSVGAEVFEKGTQSPVKTAKQAIEYAESKGYNTVIIDTAGRLHNKKNLMAELGKLNRIIEKEYPEAYRETLVVLDGTTGQNALAQAKEFKEVADITGIILTKLDGTAKGGIAVAIHSELGIPVKYIGVGESIDDLQKFDANQFVNALFNVSQDK